jgi:glutamate-1-semialdehyde 2,1-aminomutase
MADSIKSRQTFARATRVIPGGVSSPVRAFRAVGGDPIFMDRGEGAFMFDLDGNRYLDFCGSWGPLILGHAHPEVVEAVTSAVSKGMTFGTATAVEVELAEIIISKVKPLEMVRFVSSGTEAVMSAVRLARGFTHRDKIIKFNGCYHGHSDYLLVKAGSGLVTFGTPSSAGVPEDFTKHTLVSELDDEEQVTSLFKQYGNDIAAVIIEPVPANNGLLLQRPEFLRFLRDITAKHGALLIFDEVISGFRVGWGGAAEHYGITPDLMTFGKVIGGGMPVGAFGGRRDIMEQLAPLGAVYQAGTLSGNPVAMAAGITTLKILERDDIFVKLNTLGLSFERALRTSLGDAPVEIVRVGSIVWIALQGKPPRRAIDIDERGIGIYNTMHRDLLNAGIYLPPSGYEVMFISTAHTQDDLNGAASLIAGNIISRLKL